MSYDIFIGNAEVETEWPGPGEDDEPRAEWTVRRMEHPDAPFKPDLTQRSNSCHPGYSQWSVAMREVGLYEVFFDKEKGLLRHHPGIVRLTDENLRAFEAARFKYVADRPYERPGLCRCRTCDVIDGDAKVTHDATVNFNMLRLDWLCWWTRWALENCERPAMENH